MTRILILGGGFGGVRAALNLEKSLGEAAEITLIDKNSYHLFVPALYEVASAYGIKKDQFSVTLKKTVGIPFSDIFEGKRVAFIQAEIVGINLNLQMVSTKGGHSFPYDYLILALGSQTADFGIPGVREYSFQFKTLEDGLLVKEKMDELFDKLHHGEKEGPVTALICGAGFTGVELAAELALYSKKKARKFKFRNKSFRVVIFEASPKILPSISDRERAPVLRRLTELGIEIMAASTIESVGDGFIKLKDGRSVTGDLVVWTAGIEANRILRNIRDLDLSEKGKILVGEHLHTPKFKNVFAIGDNIEFIDHRTQKPIPSLGYLAIDHGKVAAKNIVNILKEKELMVHKPQYDMWIAPVGGKYSVAHVWNNILVKGILGWVLREGADLRYFLSILSVKKAFKLFFEEMQVFTKND